MRDSDMPAVDNTALILKATTALNRHGFDIVRSFPVQRYNAHIPPSVPRLPTHSRSKTLGILIGNTKSIWPHFMGNLKDREIGMDPFDRFVRERISDILKVFAPLDLRFTFDTGDKFVAFQRLAYHGAHFAYYDPSLGLCNSEEYGAWFALRACVVFDAPYEQSEESTIVPSRPFSNKQNLKLHQLLRSIIKKDMTQADIWRKWVQLRDLASTPDSIDRYKYPDAMLRYHYLKDVNILKQQIESGEASNLKS